MKLKNNKLNLILIFALVLTILSLNLVSAFTPGGYFYDDYINYEYDQYVSVPLPDGNYRWDQWSKTGSSTDADDLILMVGHIYDKEEGSLEKTIYQDINNNFSSYSEEDIPEDISGLNTGFDYNESTNFPYNWSHNSVVGVDHGMNTTTRTIYINSTLNNTNTYFLSNTFTVTPGTKYIVSYKYRTTENMQFYIQLKNTTGSYEKSDTFTTIPNDAFTTKYITFTPKDTQYTLYLKIYSVTTNLADGVFELKDLHFYENDFFIDIDIPINWSVSLMSDYEFENNTLKVVHNDAQTPSFYHTNVISLEPGVYAYSNEIKSNATNILLQVRDESTMGYVHSASIFSSNTDFVTDFKRVYNLFKLTEPTNVTLITKMFKINGTSYFRSPILESVSDINFLGREFTPGYRLNVLSVGGNICNSVDGGWCGGGHGGDLNTNVTFSNLNHNVMRVKRTATNPVYDTITYYTYDFDNYKIYESYYLLFNESQNLDLIDDFAFYVGMQTVRNVKASHELWNDGIMTYFNPLNNSGQTLQNSTEKTVHILRANNSRELYNYSYVYRSNVLNTYISEQVLESSYNKKYFVVTDRDTQYPGWKTDGMDFYVHWDTIKGAEIPNETLTDSWAPSIIYYGDETLINLNCNPTKETNITKDSTKILIEGDSANIEFREIDTLYVPTSMDEFEYEEVDKYVFEGGEDELYLDIKTMCEEGYDGEFRLNGTCLVNIQDNANETNNIVFAAFGLIALMILVSAGYLIVQMFKGEMDATNIMFLTIAAIGVSIVIFIGYYVLSTLAANIG